jgi:hypothetical protein
MVAETGQNEAIAQQGDGSHLALDRQLRRISGH